MSRCKCCDVPLVGQVRYKHGEEFDGKWVEEDFCNQCIFQSSGLEYMDVKTYQFEELTENVLNIINFDENT